MKINDIILGEKERICLICKKQYIKGEYITYLPCEHYSHTTCIENWINKQNSCPRCGFEIKLDNIRTEKENK